MKPYRWSAHFPVAWELKNCFIFSLIKSHQLISVNKVRVRQVFISAKILLDAACSSTQNIIISWNIGNLNHNAKGIFTYMCIHVMHMLLLVRMIQLVHSISKLGLKSHHLYVTFLHSQTATFVKQYIYICCFLIVLMIQLHCAYVHGSRYWGGGWGIWEVVNWDLNGYNFFPLYLRHWRN